MDQSAGLGVLTIRRLSLGAGYTYLMESIAVGDGPVCKDLPLARYYEATGTPPGVWMGAGLACLDDGRGLDPDSVVTEEALFNMLGLCVDPVSGEPCGRRPNTGGSRPPVAGFDLTFSPQKSVSVAWALANRETQAAIYECHRHAIGITLAYAEERVFHSRSGTNGILQAAVDGIVAAAFTHYDSRSGDPQLHDHVVVWNRAWSRSDGVWRTLDSRGLFKHVVTLSEIYDGVLEDLLTAELGVGWEPRMTRGGQLKVEIQGVKDGLLAEFSQRRDEMDALEDKLTKTFLAEHARSPSPVERRGIAQQANLQTRHQKQRRSLAEMTAEWRERARPHVGEAATWVDSLTRRTDLAARRTDQFTEEMLAEVGVVVLDRTAERRSTFTRANLLAEAHRQLRGVRFADHNDRLKTADGIVALAVGQSLLVSAPDIHHVPDGYRQADRTSMLRPADQHLYTTEAILDAEQRLLEAGREMDAAIASVATVAQITSRNLPSRDYPPSTDQALAVQQIATSGRRLDLLIGPAGTGKSTTMAGLRDVWEREHGPSSVLGLAPSAAAAEVLARELRIATENTAKWLYEYRRAARGGGAADAAGGRWSLSRDQLVIVDEASLAGTFALDELAAAARDAGAKVLLVGDQHQLSGVEAGGMFRALIQDRGAGVAQLEDVRRFNNTWEKEASLLLRQGRDDAIEFYEQHERISSGTRDELIAELYDRWKRDTDVGRSSLMIAADAATVDELNRRARADRVTSGQVSPNGVELSGDQRAGVGDLIVTRQNDRQITTRRGWVKNGDHWIVSATHWDGRLTVERDGSGGKVELPAAYVAEHVELGYATTAHRAQGRTVDTAHAMITSATNREALYVAATRGRDSNRLYVDTAYDPDPASGHEGMAEPRTAAEVLAAVLSNEGTELAARAQIRASWDAAESIVRLHAEYQTIARHAQAERWDRLIISSGLNSDDARRASIRTPPGSSGLASHRPTSDGERRG